MDDKNKRQLLKLTKLVNKFGKVYEIDGLGLKFRRWYISSYPNDNELLCLSEALSVFLDEWGFSLVNFIFCMCKQ